MPEDMECNSTPLPSCIDEVTWKDGLPGDGSFMVTVPPEILGKVERTINSIPNVNVTLDSLTFGLKNKERDCCQGNSKISDGESYREANAKLSAKLVGITLWGPPNITREIDLSIIIATIEFDVGIKLDSDFSVSGVAGLRQDECDSESCNYGSVNIGASISTKLTFEIIACFDSIFFEKKCADIVTTPANISVGLTGMVGVNDRENCDRGPYGLARVEDIVWSVEFSVAGQGAKFDFKIYP